MKAELCANKKHEELQDLKERYILSLAAVGLIGSIDEKSMKLSFAIGHHIKKHQFEHGEIANFYTDGWLSIIIQRGDAASCIFW